MAKWRGITLLGVGLVVAGVGFAAYALLFTGVGYFTAVGDVNVVDRSVESGVYLLVGGSVTAVAALVAYHVAGPAVRALLATVVGLFVVGLWVVGDRLLPAWHGLAEEPFAGVRVPLLEWAAGIVLLGALVVTVATPWRASWHAPRAIVPLLVGVVIGVGASVAAVTVTEPNTNGTTAAALPAPPVPTSPTARKWVWHSDRTIYDITPGGTGFVVATTDGLVAIDGTTGQERWHFHRAGAQPHEVYTFGDGAIAVAEVNNLWFGLDAYTGKVLWHREDVGGVQASTWHAATRTVLIASGFPNEPYQAMDPRTGVTVWEWRPPQQCGREGFPATTDNVVIVRLYCGDNRQGVLIGLDGPTGRQLWHHDGPAARVPGGTGLAELSVQTTGSVVIVRERGVESYVDQFTGSVLGPVTQWAIQSPAPTGDEFVTTNGDVFHAPEPTPRWQVQHGPLDQPRSVAWLATQVAVVTGEQCGQQLTLLDRATGATVRALECVPGKWHTMTVAGPGAVAFVRSPTDVVGYA